MFDISAVLKEAAKELEINLSEQQLKQLNSYYQLLIEWNEKINLTAITDPTEVAIKHFIDSITCAKVITMPTNSLILDVGTGAGFPGIPLKIYRPDLKVTLMDSLNKRISFLNTVIASLELENIEAIHDRVENFAQKKEHRENYDFVLSRAVARLSVLSEYCLPCVKSGGYFISQKGPDIDEEIKESGRAIEVLGGELISVEKLKLPVINDGRSIVIIKKTKHTPNQYPRKAGTPTKKPIT